MFQAILQNIRVDLRVKTIFAIPIYHPDTASDVSQISQHMNAISYTHNCTICTDFWLLDETRHAR